MNKLSLIMICLVALLFISPSVANAARPKSLGQYGYWRTYVLYEGKNPVCYMSLTARPPAQKNKKRKKNKKSKRGNVVLMITHRPAESLFDVVSYTAGARFQSSTDVIVRADGRKFPLFTKNSTAWARDAITDQALTVALRKDFNAIITGHLALGGKVADDVNLKGSNAAYKRISKACAAPKTQLR